MTYHVELDNGTAMTMCDLHTQLFSPATESVIDEPDGLCWLCPGVN